MVSTKLIFATGVFLAGLFFLLQGASFGAEFPLLLTDSAKREMRFESPPQRVACLAPYVTEMLVEFGREDVLVGLTRQDMLRNSGLRVKNLGSYFHPNIQAVYDCRPELIIAAPSHEEALQRFESSDVKVMFLSVKKMADAFGHMAELGRLFDCEEQAKGVIDRNREQIDLVKSRLENVPPEKRKRVARVLGGNELMWPGDDSFLNEVIEAAGGLTPRSGKNGFAVPVTLEQWKSFNPQVVFGCDQNEDKVRALLDRDGWRDVDAVKNGLVTTMFPCDLTCRVSARAGNFIQWLATVVYMPTFADSEKAVLENAVLERKPLAVDLDYVEHAEIVKHRVADSIFKTVVVRFERPQDVHSSMEGFIPGAAAAGNTFVPMASSLCHMAYGTKGAQKAIRENLGLTEGAYAGLMTGADMDNLAVKTETFGDIKVTVLATAGVRDNALRMSKDTGGYVEHGTINMIVLTNRKLTDGAMAKAVISATEAKTAALLDLDIRSTYTPLEHRATGTGTDNILMVRGEGTAADFTGGHAKIGELIAKAVYEAVIEAISKQDGTRKDRDIFQRLHERKIDLDKIAKAFPAASDSKALALELESLLSIPYYASFMETALAISDEYGKGTIKDLSFYEDSCAAVAARISGGSGTPSAMVEIPDNMPVVVGKAFSALAAGIQSKSEERRDQ